MSSYTRQRFRKSFSSFGLVLLIAGIICHIGLILYFNFTQDDAYISFRYAANFLNGDGLVYNAGERIEGYTNFLWTVLLILGRQIGIDYTLFSRILGSVLGTASIIVSFLLAKSIFPVRFHNSRIFIAGVCSLVLGTTYSFAYWGVAGLETAAFTFAVTTSLYLYCRRSFLVVPVLVIGTLLRPEGGVVFAILILYEILSSGRVTRYALSVFSVFIIFILPFMVFKLIYYGSILPNSFYAKTNFNANQVLHGLNYVWIFLKHYLGAGLFIIPAILHYRQMSPGLRVCTLFLSVYTLYIIITGGDVLKVHRFFVPLLPVMAIIVVFGIKAMFKHKLLFGLGVLIILGWQIIIPRDYVRLYHDRENSLTSKMNSLAGKLLDADQSEFSIAASTIGMLGYRLTGHRVIDLLGLTDSTIARHPEPVVEGLESSWHETHFNSPHVLSLQPDYIIFSTNVKPSAPAERALFLYSRFLHCYRTIGFYIGGSLQGIYKRYHKIETPVERNVDIRMVRNYNHGLNLLNENQNYFGAIEAFDSALVYSPEPGYPYLTNGKALAYRDMGNYEEVYRLSWKIVAEDTLIYEAYMNLYLLEMAQGNHGAAQYYRERLSALVPWLVPRLDSLVARGT